MVIVIATARAAYPYDFHSETKISAGKRTSEGEIYFRCGCQSDDHNSLFLLSTWDSIVSAKKYFHPKGLPSLAKKWSSVEPIRITMILEG